MGMSVNRRSLHLPAEVREVIILEDADDPGREAAAAAAERLIREGRSVRVACPPAGFKDFNDVLLEGVA
jgi:DNA primase